MKKLTAIIISLLIVAGLLPSGVISAESGYAGYEETLLTEPGFTADCYYKIYDTNGKALTYAENDPDGTLVLEDPVEVEKRQEWQIVSDPALRNRYRIINKYCASALTIKDVYASGELSPENVDLNNAKQEWAIQYKNGYFTFVIRNAGAITYSGRRVRSTAVTSGAKQFSIARISEPGWVEDWTDEFDYFDESKWNRADGHLQTDKAVVINVGDDEHVYIEDGSLVLRADIGDYGGYAAAAGMVDTAGKYSISYGRIEMRARLPHGYGTFPALWMLANETLWAGNGEIDIMEISNEGMADADAYLFGTRHWTTPGGSHTSEGRTLYTENRVPFSEEFHTFALEWENDQMRWFLDGMLYASHNPKANDDKYAFGDDPHFLILDNWIQGEDDGTLTPGKDYPEEYFYYIDRITVSKRETSCDYLPDETTPETTYTSTAADVVARSHDWDNEMPLAVSPDGGEIAVADGKGYIYIEDAATGLQKRMLTALPMVLLSAIEYSPDGSKLAVADFVGTILIYDTSDYDAPPLRICNGTVCHSKLLFTKDGTGLITADMPARAAHNGAGNQFDGSIVKLGCMRVFDIATGALRYETEIGGEGRGMTLSPDGGLLAVALLDGRCVLLETETFTVLAHLECGAAQARGVAFSSDSSMLAVTDERGGIYLFSVADQTLIRKLNTLKNTSMTSVRFSADDRKLLVNSSDNCARLYDVESGELLKILGGFSQAAHIAEFSPDGSRIAVASLDGRVKIYDADGGYRRTLVTSMTEHNGHVFSMKFSPSGEYVYATTYTFPKALHRWSVDGESGPASAAYDCDFFYKITDGEATVTGYRGNDRNIVVPETLGGCPVTVIGAAAFGGMGNYAKNVSITLPSTLKRIETEAFRNCWTLRELILPEGLEYIAKESIHGCKQLTELVIPDSVTFIGEDAFDWCHGLRKLVIGSGMKTVPSGICGNVRALKEVILREGVERVESDAFGTAPLEKLRFPSTMSDCADDAFASRNVKVYGTRGSYAETFCAGNTACVFVELIRGDIDGDGRISVTDALQVLRISLGMTKTDIDTVERMDMDADAALTVSDVLLIMRAAARIQ
ncbi:MAG: leucine-rich repeat protein [Clostridia bacterium]|nr:leucine-rich repeat protein [Clostridia bacterium]